MEDRSRGGLGFKKIWDIKQADVVMEQRGEEPSRVTCKFLTRSTGGITVPTGQRISKKDQGNNTTSGA